VQPLIRQGRFRLYALDDSQRGGFFTARLESWPKHLVFNRERRHEGKRGDGKTYRLIK
jgi:hypothetical protein